MKTHQERVAEALALLAPAPERLADCWRDIVSKIYQIERLVEMRTEGKASRTKPGKEALQRYLTALANLRSAYEGLGDLRPWFSLNGEWLEHDFIKASDLLKAKPGAPKRSATRAKTAVPIACALLTRWGHKPAVTRGGEWERLTKILADTDASVFEHIRAFNKAGPIFGKLVSAPVREPGAW